MVKIPIKVPNWKTQNTLKRWFGTSRYVYNKGVNCLNDKIVSFITLRNKLVNHKATAENGGAINPEILDWELETPKVVRAGSLDDLCKGLKICLKRLAMGQISHFNLRFKSKKDKKASIVINKEAPKLTKNGIILFKKLLPVEFKVGKRNHKKWFGKDMRLEKLWNHKYDIRLVTDGYKYWLNFPVKGKYQKTAGKGTVALDPGLNPFQTCYSDREVTICRENRWELIKKLRAKLDGLRRARTQLKPNGHNKINKCVFGRRYHKWARKLENLCDGLHWDTITYLTKNYNSIFLPHFETQAMRENRLNKLVNRNFDYFRHYKFKIRLKEKCRERGIDLFLVDESYTSLTCGMCGRVKNKKELGGSKVYKCPLDKGGCGSLLDRDVNGARNILIKNTTRKILIKLKPKKVLIKLKPKLNFN